MILFKHILYFIIDVNSFHCCLYFLTFDSTEYVQTFTKLFLFSIVNILLLDFTDLIGFLKLNDLSDYLLVFIFPHYIKRCSGLV